MKRLLTQTTSLLLALVMLLGMLPLTAITAGATANPLLSTETHSPEDTVPANLAEAEADTSSPILPSDASQLLLDSSASADYGKETFVINEKGFLERKNYFTGETKETNILATAISISEDILYLLAPVEEGTELQTYKLPSLDPAEAIAFTPLIAEAFCLVDGVLYFLSEGILYEHTEGGDFVFYNEFPLADISIREGLLACRLLVEEPLSEEEPSDTQEDPYTYVFDPLTGQAVSLIAYMEENGLNKKYSKGVSYTVKVGNTTLPLSDYPIGSYATSTGKACRTHGGGAGDCLDTYVDPTTGKNVYVHGWQCVGFARYVFYRCFGFVDWASTNSSRIATVVENVAAGRITENYLRSIFGTVVKPGAHIRTNKGSNGYQHSLIYMGSDSNYIYTYECNIDGHCIVTTVQRTWGEMVTYLKSTKPGISYIHMPKEYPNPCSHTYTSGLCSKCGCFRPLQKESVSCKTGIYATSATGYAHLRKDPYTVGENFSNNLLQGFNRVRKEVVVTGAVVNGKGETWYKVTYGSLSGYMIASEITFVREIPASVECNNLGTPSGLKLGSSYRISGTVTATNCKILRVRAYFRSSSNGSIVSNSTTAWVNVNSTSFSLYNSAVDNALKFGRLAKGQYYYCIEAETDRAANGKTSHEFKSGAFTVEVANVPAPSIVETSSAVGSKTFTLKGTGTLYYRLNGGAWTQGSSFTVYSTTSIEAKCVSGGVTSAVSNLYATITQTTAPSVSSTMTAEGALVKISGDSASTIYYQLDGGTAQKYTGSFTVAKACTVTAYAEQNGYIRSETATCSVTVSPPGKLTIARDTPADVAEGTAMTIRWNKDSLASHYTITVKKDGMQWKTETVTVTQYTFATEGKGKYEVSVVAKNVVGTGNPSNTVGCTAHAPSTVTFLDHDGTLLSTQTVAYGASATKPLTPQRRGYTFDSWSGSYTNVTEDIALTAQYEINYYTVSFYDVDGSTLLTTQDIAFNEAINSAAAEALVNVENGGRVFTGWYIVNAAEDSERDLYHIDSDISLRAVTVWGKESLPVYVDNISAKLLYDTKNGVFNGYNVSCKVSTAEQEDIKAKIIVTLLAVTDEETGACKMINTKVDTIHLTLNSSNLNWTGDILCDGTCKADFIEISVVSVEGNDRTGGLISETKRYPLSDEIVKLYSGWMTEAELLAAGCKVTDATVESKTQYSDRTNTKSTVTNSSSTPPAGYTLQSDNSYWGSWSAWSDSAVSATSTRQVETRSTLVSQGYTEYRYGSWYNGSRSHFCGAYYSGLYLRYTDWSTTKYPKQYGDTENYCPNYTHYQNGKHVGYVNYDGRTFFWPQWLIGGKNYYWEESRWVDTSYYKTQYRYRDYVGSYTYYKWDYGNWSDWTDTILTDSNPSDPAYEVRTQTLYRYVIFDAGQLQSNTNGTTQTISGALEDANSDPEGKLATILVYKSLNNDPTESQLEYVGQTKLGAKGTYSFTFTTKETVSAETGDFVVALAVEGSNGLINVDMVKYQRPTYTVTFVTEGATIGTCQVEAGGTATSPEAPETEGYTFTGWNRNLTNITKNLTVTAQYKPKTYSVVFVDYLNRRCVLEHYSYGTVMTIPTEMANPTCTGYTFLGWSCGADATVTGDMIVSAQWQVNDYTVTFYDETGKTAVSTQTVPYGGSATPPQSLSVSSEKVFLSWSESNPWWDVKNDVSVYPVVICKETTAAPLSNIFDITEGLYEEVIFTSEENATIYYTLDGSEPHPSRVGASSADGITYIYTGPISLTQDTLVKAKAVCQGKNDSNITEVLFIHTDVMNEAASSGDAVELKTENVKVAPYSTVEVRVELGSNPNLEGYGVYVKADPEIFYVDFDEKTLMPSAPAGTLCAGGSLLVEDYDEVLGWHILWLGDPSTLTKGSLLTVNLVAGGHIQEGSYPITVGYTTADTFSSKDESVTLETISAVTIAPRGHVHDYSSETTPATCTVAGQTLYTCKICGNSYTDPVATLGHSYTSKVTVPTCTVQGYTTYTCSRCSDSYTDTYTDATGHSYTYTDCGETHEGVCRNCADSVTQSHSYSEGVCICGAPEIVPPILDETITIGHTLNLASEISVNYAVKASLLAGYDSFYMVVTIPKYSDNLQVGTSSVTLEPVVNGNYYYFTLTEITAVQMNDTLEATLYMCKGKQTYISNPDSYSIATYAYNQLDKDGMPSTLKALCANLLRYGAAAQHYKGYRTDAIVSASMTSVHESYLSDLDSVTFGNTNKVFNDLSSPIITWVGKTLSLESKVVVKFIFDAGAYTGDVSKLTLRLVYQDTEGIYQSVTLTEPTVYDAARRRYVFDFDGLMAAELRSAISATVYAGNVQLSQTLQYSPDTYGNGKPGLLSELCKALFAYSDSAKAYFS